LAPYAIFFCGFPSPYSNTAQSTPHREIASVIQV
jgi:hypothetical protein